MSNQLLLSLKEVIVSYHKKEIFKDLDLIIHRKDFIALVGKNGAGKTTLMNVLTESHEICLLYTSPSPRDQRGSRMPSSA